LQLLFIEVNKVIPNYKMLNGVEIPQVGFGTWQIPDGPDTETAVLAALGCGYRHIDTAYAYNNEKGVGSAMEKSGVPRGELFITTKLWNTDQGYDETLENFELSLRNLRTDYLDLYLIHWPQTFLFFDEYPKRMQDTWRAFEELYKTKKIKAIGLSNFLMHHIEELMETGTIYPMVNQLEIHPGYNQSETVDYCLKNGIVVECWSPLANGNLLKEGGLLTDIGKEYGKSAAQVALRWCLQSGLLPLPRSVKPDRIAENLALFDFELSEADMKSITGMPETCFSGYHHDHPDFLKGFG